MRLIYGAGGHGRVLLDTLRLLDQEPDGFIDDVKVGATIEGLPSFGSTILDERDDIEVYHGIGYIDVRRRIDRDLEARGVRTLTVVHPAAFVSPTAELGEGTVVYAGAMVNTGARVGRAAILNTGCVVDHDCEVGDYTHISPNAALGGGVTVGDGTWVGIGSSVIELVNIGANAILGAGAVAVADVPDRVVAVGCPARVVKRR